jgi:hypothetical protein
MKKLTTIIFLITNLAVFAQGDRIDSLLNDLIYSDSDPLMMPEKPVKFDFIFTGANFNSSTFYAGREVSSNMYNISGHIFYYSSTGLFAGVSGIWFDELTPSYSTTTLSAGFSKAIDKSKLLTFRTSYSRFLYYSTDTASVYPYKNNFSLGLTFRKKWVGARVSANLLFGDEYRVNISSGIYSRFTIAKFGKYNKIYSAPDLSVFFGPETVETSKSNNSETTNNLKDVYSLLNTQLYIPIGISVGDFDLELSYSVNFPTTQDINTTYPVSSFYSISIGYLFPIMKQ